MYETTFRIHDHTALDRANPFPLATFHETRDNNWAMRSAIKALLDGGVPEKTQMGLHELLQLPVDVYDTCTDLCYEINKAEDSALNGSNSELGAQLKETLAAMSNKKK